MNGLKSCFKHYLSANQNQMSIKSSRFARKEVMFSSKLVPQQVEDSET